MARLSPLLADARCLLFCLWFSGCLALWRYRTNTGDYFIFSTRTTIHLEYEGNSFQEWDTGSFCTASDKSSPKTTMHCTIPGTHKIEPIVKNPSFEDEERYLSVISDVNCFMWYVYQDVSTIQSEFVDMQSVTAWIFDPENAHESELNHTAASPPLYSKTLSKQFKNLGQRPSIITVLQKEKYHGESRQEGSWTIDVPTVSTDIVAHISGSDITFQDCFVLQTPIVIAQLGTTFFFGDDDTSISLPPGSNSKVIWSACVPTSAVLATDFGTFYTTDGFLTSQEIRISLDLINITKIHLVKELAMVFRDSYILIDSVVYKITDYEVYTIEDLPATGIIGLRARTWCASQYPTDKGRISSILIWTADEIYHGFPGDEYVLLEDTSGLKKHLHLEDTVDLVILTVCYDSLPSIIIMLLECTGCMSSPVLYLAAYDEETQKWFLKDFALPPSTLGDMHIEVLYSTTTSMVLWNDDTIYYTYKQNKIHGYFKLTGTNTIFSAAVEGSPIHQITIDYGANSIIKLKNNAIFFFKVEMTEIIRLPVWVNERMNCIFYFNPSGDAYLLTIDGHNISREVYPLKLEVFSTTYTSREVCPYISFQHNIELDSYYLDKGENITFWAQMVFLENLGLSTEAEIHALELLKQKTYMHYEIARGICTKNWTVTFYHDQDYSEVSNYTDEMIRSSGVMTVELQPSLSGNTCVTKSMLTHLRVGCFPDKYVLIESDRPTTCKTFNYTIPQKYLWEPTGEEDLNLLYNLGYGCPIEIHHATPFRPTLGIYVNRMRIGTVESDYILWEANGRKDFAYNSTMKQVRCLHIAQNWTMMLSEVHNMTFQEAIDLDDLDFMKLWGPHNYKSCFTADYVDQRHLEKEYVILNNSGINFVIWPEHHTGVYLFKLRIVDPNFRLIQIIPQVTFEVLEDLDDVDIMSFCDPVVKFSVRTFGVTERPNFLKIAGWAILIVTFFLGVLLCSYFRYVKIFRELRFVDPLLSFRQHPSPTESAEELKKH